MSNCWNTSRSDSGSIKGRGGRFHRDSCKLSPKASASSTILCTKAKEHFIHRVTYTQHSFVSKNIHTWRYARSSSKLPGASNSPSSARNFLLDCSVASWCGLFCENVLIGVAITQHKFISRAVYEYMYRLFSWPRPINYVINSRGIVRSGASCTRTQIHQLHPFLSDSFDGRADELASLAQLEINARENKQQSDEFHGLSRRNLELCPLALRPSNAKRRLVSCSAFELKLSLRVSTCADRTDPRTNHWLLVESPWPMLSIVFLYLAVVFYGPKIMKSMRPFELRPLMVAYNLLLVFLNSYMCAQVFFYHLNIYRSYDVYQYVLSIAYPAYSTIIVLFHNKSSGLYLHLWCAGLLHR